MELILKRLTKTDASTIGELTINGMHECYILEDVDRGLMSYMNINEILSKKAKGITAIPTGRYEVVVSWSNRFKTPLPLLMNVPGYEGIRIHPGNTAADTEGCLLPGVAAAKDRVLQSRVAFSNLFAKIKKALKTEKVFITIE